MNKPIRTISIFCLLLFLALMANATYLQYYKSGALDEDPRNQAETESADVQACRQKATGGTAA